MQTLLKVLTGIFFALLFCAVLSLGGCLDSQPEPVIPKNIPTCHLCEFRSPDIDNHKKLNYYSPQGVETSICSRRIVQLIATKAIFLYP